MCLLFIAVNSHPVYSLIVAGNRDEFYKRPTRSLHQWEDHPGIFAGRDLEKSGTWFGVTEAGRWAAVTNYRESNPPAELTSRGELVSGYLNSSTTPASYIEALSDNAHNYNGFNLILGSADEAVYFSNREHNARAITSGVFGLSNHLLDTPWPKLKSGKRSLQNLLEQPDFGPDALFSILSNDAPAADHELPDTGLNIEWERLLSSAFVSGSDYGTRSSTVLMINRNNRLDLEERTYNRGDNGGPGRFFSSSYAFKVNKKPD